MGTPVVSVIGLCYNQRQFVHQAIQSVLDQSYKNIQLIIVDDGSTDGSQRALQEIVKSTPSIQLILLTNNQGNCKAFNRGLIEASGDFIIDFALDDVMLPNHIERQVNFFSLLGNEYGVVFTDADYIDSQGKMLRTHFDYLIKKKLLKAIPNGNVFEQVLTTYFIASPTMMIRKKVMNDLHGYDESLSYEDFDFWIRAARNYKFAYLNEKQMLIRRTGHSMSSGWYKTGDRQLASTYRICVKTIDLCRNEQERKALLRRVLYEYRQSIFSENRREAKLFQQLAFRMGETSLQFYGLQICSVLPLPWSIFRKLYYRLRFGESFFQNRISREIRVRFLL